MAKTKNVFVCQGCGYKHHQWVGKCMNCGEWNTIVEEIEETTKNKNQITSIKTKKSQVISISEISLTQEDRIVTSYDELNRVLGGGMVLGAVHLLGGEPGIGKSTLMLQLALSLKDKIVLYVSGEESPKQIKMRAQRLSVDLGENCKIYTETSLALVFEQINNIKPDLLVIDSIQTLSSNNIEAAAGSVSQIRQTAAELIHFAKQSNTPIILVGHINKEGHIAGPKVLEHMVDVVLQFQGDRNNLYRLLRSHKNRFGPTSELGIFEMTNKGLSEVANPSFLLSQTNESFSGNAIAVMIEGARPMMIEIQALVSTAVYGTPQRATTGFDVRRLNMLLAVLEKRAGFQLASKDVFLNITGGIKVEDPAIDLAIIAAILSSATDIPIGKNICFASEIGLSGELRSVLRLEQRINEAAKLGYEKIVVASENKLPKTNKIQIVGVSGAKSLKDVLFQ